MIQPFTPLKCISQTSASYVLSQGKSSENSKKSHDLSMDKLFQ